MDPRPDDEPDAGETTPRPRPGASGAGPVEEPTSGTETAGTENSGTETAGTENSGTEAPSDARPSTGTPTDAEAWASIVARLSDVDGGTEPALRRVPPDADRHTTTDDDARDLGPMASTGRDWDGTSQYDAAEDDVDELEHFVPEDPGPVTGGDPLLTLAWSAVGVAPVLLLLVVTVWRDAPALLVRGAAVAFVLAVGVLVWRMPQHREPSDGDGAVV